MTSQWLAQHRLALFWRTFSLILGCWMVIFWKHAMMHSLKEWPSWTSCKYSTPVLILPLWQTRLIFPNVSLHLQDVTYSYIIFVAFCVWPYVTYFTLVAKHRKLRSNFVVQSECLFTPTALTGLCCDVIMHPSGLMYRIKPSPTIGCENNCPIKYYKPVIVALVLLRVSYNL